MPNWRRYVRENLRLMNVSPEREADAVEEIARQFEDAYLDALRSGLSAEEAEHEAKLHVTDWSKFSAQLRRTSRYGWIDGLRQDFRHVLRRTRRRPAFTLAVIMTLALGIGANTAIFGVVYHVLIKPLPYPNADELVAIWHAAPGVQKEDMGVASSMYFTYREENRTFQTMGLWSTGAQNVTGLGEPEQVQTVFATYGTLQTLG